MWELLARMELISWWEKMFKRVESRKTYNWREITSNSVRRVLSQLNVDRRSRVCFFLIDYSSRLACSDICAQLRGKIRTKPTCMIEYNIVMSMRLKEQTNFVFDQLKYKIFAANQIYVEVIILRNILLSTGKINDYIVTTLNVGVNTVLYISK